MRKVRLGAAVVLAVFFTWLVWRASTDDGFRFIWNRDEGEFVVFVGAVGLASLVLHATGLQPRGFAQGGGRWMVRAVAYICGAVALMLLALGAGTAYYDATDCPSGDSDCLSLLGGMVWSLVSLAVSAVVVVVIELVLWRRRRNTAANRAR
ncbi:hypothetical protein ABZX12_07510 [Kribbella sp. NPDC003505]|uniref:hypothetical protein n=1 Tax=Kribbella sp. NPDC003505 TaxID=3154448 RepID=UPI0033A3C0BD